MKDYAQRIIVVPSPTPNTPERELLVKWLARIRGPEAQDPPLSGVSPAAWTGDAGDYYQYELPWLGVNVHDVAGDAEGASGSPSTAAR